MARRYWLKKEHDAARLWQREDALWRGDPATARQMRKLDFHGVSYFSSLTKGQASDLICGLQLSAEEEREYDAWKAAGEPDIDSWHCNRRNAQSATVPTAPDERPNRDESPRTSAQTRATEVPISQDPAYQSVNLDGPGIVSGANAEPIRRKTWRSLGHWLALLAIVGAGLIFAVWAANAFLSAIEELPAKRTESAPAPSTPMTATIATPRTLPTGTEAAQAQTRAVAKKYPALGVSGSALNRAFIERVHRYKTEAPDIFDDPDWPLKIADRIAAGE